MDDVVLFTNNQLGKIRVVIQDGGIPWFIGKDVATILGDTNTRKALIDYVDDEDNG